MELEEVKKFSLDLMETSKAAYLTTIDSEGYPITRAMFNLRNKEQFPEFSKFFSDPDNKFDIYISTNTSSSKTNHIAKNPKISVYYCEPEEFKGVMFGGEVEVINDINNHLINFYNIIKHSPEEFTAALQYELISREIFNKYLLEDEGLSNIQKAVRFTI